MMAAIGRRPMADRSVFGQMFQESLEPPILLPVHSPVSMVV